MDKYFTNLMMICCSIMFYLGMNLFGEFWDSFRDLWHEIFFGIHEICLGFMRYVWDLRGIVWGYWVDDGWWGSLHWWIMILIEGYWKWIYCHWMAQRIWTKPSLWLTCLDRKNSWCGRSIKSGKSSLGEDGASQSLQSLAERFTKHLMALWWLFKDSYSSFSLFISNCVSKRKLKAGFVWKEGTSKSNGLLSCSIMFRFKRNILRYTTFSDTPISPRKHPSPAFRCTSFLYAEKASSPT